MCRGLGSMRGAIYFLYPASVGGLGPRYFLAYFPFLVLAVVEFYRWICHDSGPVGRRLWNFAIAGLIVCGLVFVATEGCTMYWRRDLERAVVQVRDRNNMVHLEGGAYYTA